MQCRRPGFDPSNISMFFSFVEKGGRETTFLLITLKLFDACALKKIYVKIFLAVRSVTGLNKQLMYE